MTAWAFYNEIDPYAAQWLRNAMDAGLIAPGYVDERSIEDIRPDDLDGFTQCHFFAGIGIWSIALRRVGWPDDRPIWSMSCPCQPFSEAGAGAGFADERHLWPAAFHLITQRRPIRIVGEQVASADGIRWLDLVQSDLEGLDYAPRAVPFPAAGVGAPNLRDRTYWVADAHHAQRRPGTPGGDDRDGPDAGWAQGTGDAQGRGAHGGMADTYGRRAGHGELQRSGQHGQQSEDRSTGVMEHPHCSRRSPWGSEPSGRRLEPRCELGGVAYSDSLHPKQLEGRRPRPGGKDCEGPHGQPAGRSAPRDPSGAGPVNGPWRDADWLFCRDGRWRPVRPGSFVLAHGVANRASKLRAAGNAIALEAAEAFLTAVREEDYE